jgi:orotidine-5'-phosphate decarboxylase
VPVVKPQSAFFEQFGAAGLAALERTIAYAKKMDLLVLEDAKRGDIGKTMAAYATALLGRHSLSNGEVPIQDVDAVTISPYLGGESLSPMLAAAIRYHKGVFVLVRTSNPGSGELQLLETVDGRKVFEHVAKMVDSLGARHTGERGFSSVGAVCGLTYPQDAADLRKLMPHAIFLVPGLGPQGGQASDFPLFLDRDGQGAIVAAARAIASGWQTQPNDLDPLERMRTGARRAAQKANDDLDDALSDAGVRRW